MLLRGNGGGEEKNPINNWKRRNIQKTRYLMSSELYMTADIWDRTWTSPAKNILKEKNLLYLISKSTVKLQCLKHCRTGRGERQIFPWNSVESTETGWSPRWVFQMRGQGGEKGTGYSIFDVIIGAYLEKH